MQLKHFLWSMQVSLFNVPQQNVSYNTHKFVILKTWIKYGETERLGMRIKIWEMYDI